MFTLAHLSDPHIAPLPPVRWRDLANKRLLGYLSWMRRRRHVHKREVLDALTRDLRAQTPDHTVVTGDLTNIALPAEFEQAAGWLQELGPPDAVTVIPGNHDASVAVAWERSLAHFAGYMTPDTPSDGAENPTASAREGRRFPFVRQRGEVALIGLSTAVPTLPALATGALGAEQIALLERELSRLGREGLFRCLLLHHPPVEGMTARRKRLVDAAALRRVIARTGAELVLHGHDHRRNRSEIPGPRGGVPVCGVPSASSIPSHGRPGALYQLYGIARDGDGWRIELRGRACDAEAAGYESEEALETIRVRNAG